MKLKCELKKQGLIQVYVAKDLGIHPSKFNGIANGWLRPTSEQRLAIARYLRLDPDRLFPAEKRGRGK